MTAEGPVGDPRLSVLLVDDNLSDAHLVLRRLRDEPFRIHHVRTGGEGVEAVAQQAFDTILLDHRLPDRPGIEVCRQLRDAGVETRIIIFSSIQDDALVEEALQAGADDYLAKEIVMPQLARFLKRQLIAP